MWTCNPACNRDIGYGKTTMLLTAGEKEAGQREPVQEICLRSSACRMIRKILYSLLVTVLFLAIAGQPAAAHTAGEMGIAADQYDQGIPVYWPYHAVLMAAGFTGLLAGTLVVRFSRKAGRFRTHKILQTTGAGAMAAGLAVAVFMVSLSSAPHLRYFHDQLGAGIVILVLVTLVIGYALLQHQAGPGIRADHRRIGWLAIVLMAVNIVLGITMMTMVLAQ